MPDLPDAPKLPTLPGKATTPDSDFTSNQAPRITSWTNNLWTSPDIDEKLWNKSMPYQLLMVKVDNKGPKPTYSIISDARFTLPCGIQELNISMPFATNVQATLGGISETHGGAPFRDIVITGTTGITPYRGTAASGMETDGLLGGVGKQVAGIFGGTVNAIQNVRTAVTTVLGGGSVPNLNQEIPAGKDNSKDLIPEFSTGYYQYMLLQRFLESYAEVKSKNKMIEKIGVHSRDIRLAFAVWKEKAVYLCSGVQLQRKKSANMNPHMVTFTLQLKAWARVELQGTPPAAYENKFKAREPSLIAEAFNRFRAAREAVDAGNDVLRSVVTDACEVVNNTLRQTSLFLKSVGGITKTCRDFPETIQKEFAKRIALETELRRRWEAIIPASVNEEMNNDVSLGSISQPVGAGSAGASVPNASIPSLDALGPLFDQLPVSSINVDPSTLRQIDEEIRKAEGLNRFDFEAMRDELRQITDQFAYVVGGGNETYAETYDEEFVASSRTPTAGEYDVLFAMNEILQILDGLAVSGQIDPKTPTSLEYVAGLAEQSGIAFRVPQSKFPVPFPYGITLERLAALYLGDPNRWHEIATLNGLRTPYIDEEGFSLPLLVNGDGNQVVVSDATNLYIGQPVYLTTDSLPRELRYIQQIEAISLGNVLLTLAGDEDLETYTTEANATLEAFLPGTVNSRQVIYIPSENEADVDPELKAVPGVDTLDPLLQVGGMDLLLTEDGDLVITPDGDCRIAVGLTNIVQTVRLALSTPKGSLLQHPEYGIAIPVGTSTADITAAELLASAREFFLRDPTFSSVRGASVVKRGNSVYMSVELGVAASGTFIPITIQVKR